MFLASIVRCEPPDHDGWVRKEIPAHLEEKYGLREPNVVHVPDHDITEEDLMKGNVRDPTKKKSHWDVPRMKDYHETDLHHSEIDIQQNDIDDARHHHRYDYKYKQQILSDSTEDRDLEKYRDLKNMEQSPDLKNVFNMIMKVRFRPKYTTRDEDIHYHAMTIETDLLDFEVDYQSISIKESVNEEDEPSYL